MRDFILCAVIVTIVSSGTTVAQRYLANLPGDRNTQHTELSPHSKLTEQDVQTDSSAEMEIDCTASLANSEAMSSPAAVEAFLLPKAKARPGLGEVQRLTVRKPDAQPLLVPPVLVGAPAKPEKKMVGPDGVTFTRTVTAPQKLPAVVRGTRPVAPELLGPAEQAKASPIGSASTSNGNDEQAAIAAVNKSDAGQPAAPTTTKVSGLMVGPDGVIYRPKEGPRGVTPH